MRDVIDAAAHHHLDRPIAGVQQRPEILARQIGGERAAVMCAKALVAFAVHDAGADGDELQQMLVPLQALDGQLHADDAVRAHRRRLGAHARHRQFAGVVHRLGEDIQLLVLAPAAVLDADMIDAGADAQADRLEAGLAHQQELVDREIRGEHAGRMLPRCAGPSAAPWRGRECRSACQIAPSSSLDA